MWKSFLMECKKCWKKLALLLWLLFSVAFLQVAVAQEAFILTSAEMEELERLLEALKSENEQLILKSENLTSLSERLREALERRTESLDALQNSYSEFERNSKKAMSEMSEKIVLQKERIKRLKIKIFVMSTSLFLSLLVSAIYLVWKIKKGG